VADLPRRPLERAEILTALSEVSIKLLALGFAIDGLTNRAGDDANRDALNFILNAASHDLNELYGALKAERSEQGGENG
jgi:hypothetical protein